jgi:PAS domain S-box-containing protein
MRRRLSPSRLSLRAYLVLLVGAAVLPVALFAVGLTVTIARDQRTAQRGRMQDTASALAVAIDRGLLAEVHTLQAVAASSVLDGFDREAQRAELRRVAAGQREWLAITLDSPDGRRVLDTESRLESAPPSEPDRVRDVLDRGTPVVSREAVTPAGAFAVRVPVVRDGSPRYVLSATISAGAVTDVLGRQALPARWIGSLVDGRGDVFARNPEASGPGAAQPRFAITLAGGGAGWGGRTELPEGPVYFAYARPHLADWHVVLAAPVAVVDRPWMRSLAAWAGGGLAVLLGAILLAVLAARPIIGSLRALAGAAAELRRGRRPTPIGGAVADLAVVSRDLEVAGHAREKAERVREESLAQLSAIVNQATAGIARIDAAGRFVLVNRRYGELVGRAPDDLLGRALGDVLHPDDRTPVMDTLRGLTADTPERATEARYRASDGSYRWVDASFSLVRGARTPDPTAPDPGTPAVTPAIAIVALDATARRAALEAAGTGDAWFRAVADAAPVPVWLASPDTRRTWFNSQWLAFVGRRVEEEIGGGWLQHVHPDDRGRCIETARRDFAARRRFVVEYRLRRHDGVDRWVRDDGVPLYAADGTFTGYVGAGVDVTDQKVAEWERDDLIAREQQARRDAEAAGQARDDFLAALSHELRTPLNTMRLWAGVLRNGLRDPQGLARAADTIDRNALVQVRLIEDLLDVSRIVSGRLRLAIERVALGPVVEAALETAGIAALNKGVALIRRLDPEVGVVRGDATRLQQVVWNLLTNAVRFTPAGGRVEVRLRRAGGLAELTVTDSGRGIAPELLPHVFDRFRQGESGTTRSHGGLGLGLSLARQLVELHGGTIEAASPGEGAGATFTVRLPLAGAAPGPDPGARQAARGERMPRPLEDVHVLVVDDDALARELMAVALGQEGATVTTATSVAEALAAVERHWPDVLLSDIGMPGEDGYDLIRKVRRLEAARGRHIPAIALTGYAADDDRRRALDAGYEVHVAKPVPAASVTPLIASLLDRRPGFTG